MIMLNFYLTLPLNDRKTNKGHSMSVVMMLWHQNLAWKKEPSSNKGFVSGMDVVSFRVFWQHYMYVYNTYGDG